MMPFVCSKVAKSLPVHTASFTWCDQELHGFALFTGRMACFSVKECRSSFFRWLGKLHCFYNTSGQRTDALANICAQLKVSLQLSFRGLLESFSVAKLLCTDQVQQPRAHDTCSWRLHGKPGLQLVPLGQCGRALLWHQLKPPCSQMYMHGADQFLHRSIKSVKRGDWEGPWTTGLDLACLKLNSFVCCNTQTVCSPEFVAFTA